MRGPSLQGLGYLPSATPFHQDDLEIAFECLEVARLCYEKYPGQEDKEKMLAEVLYRAGEVDSEVEMFDKAIEDFGKCLKLREKYFKSTDQLVGDVQFKLGASYWYGACLMRRDKVYYIYI